MVLKGAPGAVFKTKSRKERGWGLRRAEEPRKQAEGRLGLNPASTTCRRGALEPVFHLSDCPGNQQEDHLAQLAVLRAHHWRYCA